MQNQNCTVGTSTEANSKMLGSAEDIRQWEEARCPVCLEHPHNAVLLRCSSYDNGCRPFMCNTSSHHSNCLDQFRNSPVSSPSRFIMPGILCGQTDIPNGQSEETLTCPLCRGQVYGWFVIEPAREFMNSKTRSCSTETCEFTGNYMELRKHARSEHPHVRPSAVDPERLRNWARLESETNISDMLSLVPSLNLDGNGQEVEEEGVLILNDIDTGFDEHFAPNIGFATDNNLNMAMLDDILCFRSMFLYANWMRMMNNSNGQWNYFRGNHTERLPLPPNNFRQNPYWNSNDFNFIPRQNNSYGDRFGGNNRNQNNVRHNNDNNNLNPRQNNSFRGNNTQRMRDTRVNSSAQNNSWRNRFDTRGNGSRDAFR